MTTKQARQIFNALIAEQTDPDKIAKLELCREYLTNPEFRKNMENWIWILSQQHAAT